jgi:hypothetical protein
MADNTRFESWRSTWVQYAPIVMAAAQVLHPSASEEELEALVLGSAAQGFVDTDRIDPLDALLARLLHGRTPPERTAVGRSVVVNGIDLLRAATVTGSTASQLESQGALRRNFGSDAATKPPDFDLVRTRAQEYETTSTDFANDQLVTSREGGSKQSESVDDGANQRSRKRWPILVAGVGVVCALVAGAVVVTKDLFKTKRADKNSVGFLIAASIPEPWELVDAKAFVPFPSIGSTVVAQRFTNSDKSITIFISTNSNDSRYSDPSLGVKKPDDYPVGVSRKDSKAEPMGGAGKSKEGQKAPDLFKIWGEQKTFSFMQSSGLSAKDADSFVTALTPRTNLAHDGWATPDGRFVETVLHPDVSAGSRYGSTLEFWSKSNHLLRVVIGSSKAASTKWLDFYTGLDRATVRTPSGRLLTKLQSGPRSSYLWTEGANSNFAQVGLIQDRFTPPPSANQGAPEVYFDELALQTQDLAKAEILLDALRVGTSQQWSQQLTTLRPELWAAKDQASSTGRVSTDDLRAQKLGFLARTPLTIGPNQLQIAGGKIHGKAVGLCTKTLCTRIYRDSESSTDSADAIINGHWWHFENLATNEDEPTFRTSPATTGGGDVTIFPTADAPLDKFYRWWGIDFGTTTQAARRNEQRELHLRPIQ